MQLSTLFDLQNVSTEEATQNEEVRVGEKAVAYLRVSQEDESIENQKMKILEFAKQKNLEIVLFFADVGISGTLPPRQRPQYSAMLRFCKLNEIKTIVFYDLSRLARDVIEGLNELKRLADEGYNIYFAGMDFLNYNTDPMLKKKIIMDFLWFAELYVEDIKRRTMTVMERLRREGKIYHRPRLIHYVALYLSGKHRFSELTQKDIESARDYIRRLFGKLVRAGATIDGMYREFLAEFSEMYSKLRTAPRSKTAFRALLRDAGLM